MERTRKSKKEKTNEEIARLICMRRVHLGLSKKELAKKAGISYNYLTHIEKCEKNISISVFIDLLEALGMEMEVHTL